MPLPSERAPCTLLTWPQNPRLALRPLQGVYATHEDNWPTLNDGKMTLGSSEYTQERLLVLLGFDASEVGAQENSTHVDCGRAVQLNLVSACCQ